MIDIPSYIKAPESLCSVIISVHSPIERAGVHSIVSQAPDKFHLLSEPETIEETLQLVAENHPDLLLFAHKLKAGEKAAAIAEFHRLSPHTKILATICDEEEFELDQFIKCNVKVFFKSIPSSEALILGLQSAMTDAIVVSYDSCPFQQPAPAQPNLAGHDKLSKREKEVVDLLLKGMSNKQIAQELVLDLDTVKGHVSHVIKKFGVRSRTELVIQIMTSSQNHVVTPKI